MAFLALGFALFFVKFATKIPAAVTSFVIKYFGAGSMFFTFLIVTPLHDAMIPVASILFLISVTCITLYLFKSKLHWLKIVAVMFHLIFYYSIYLLGIGNDRLLPAMQKVTFVMAIVFIATLDYFTGKQDFKKTPLYQKRNRKNRVDITTL